MKRLTITYDNTVLFDGEIEELGWQDSPIQVSVIGKLKRQSSPTASGASGGAGGGLMDLLAGVSKSRTAEVVKERKRQLAAEADATAATVVYQEGSPTE
jgi:hypothetical protein